MNYFDGIIKPMIATATKIHHYPSFKIYQFLDDNDKVLVGLFTEKNSQQLAERHHLPTYEFKKNRYFKYEIKLKIELKKLRNGKI